MKRSETPGRRASLGDIRPREAPRLNFVTQHRDRMGMDQIKGITHAPDYGHDADGHLRFRGICIGTRARNRVRKLQAEKCRGDSHGHPTTLPPTANCLAVTR